MNDTGIAKATQNAKRMLRNNAKNNTTRMNPMMPLFTNKSMRWLSTVLESRMTSMRVLPSRAL